MQVVSSTRLEKREVAVEMSSADKRMYGRMCACLHDRGDWRVKTLTRYLAGNAVTYGDVNSALRAPGATQTVDTATMFSTPAACEVCGDAAPGVDFGECGHRACRPCAALVDNMSRMQCVVCGSVLDTSEVMLSLSTTPIPRCHAKLRAVYDQIKVRILELTHTHTGCKA